MLTARTILLLIALGALAGSMAYAAAGAAGALLYLAVVLALSTAAYWGRTRQTLRLLGARPLPWYEAPELHELTVALARRAGLPAPRLYLLPGAQANAVAVATARESAIGVTAALLEHLPPAEVAAVIAHEVAHLRHKDLPLALVAGGLAGAASLLAELGRWGLILGFLLGLPVAAGAALLALGVATGVPLLALALRMALSREREYLADAGAAALVGDPELLARALWRLDQVNRGAWWQRLFGLVPPAPESGFLTRLFSSHPPVQSRIARLLAQSGRRHLGAFGRLHFTW